MRWEMSCEWSLKLYILFVLLLFTNLPTTSEVKTKENFLTEKRNVLKDLKSLRADYNEFFKRRRKPSLKFIMKSINLNNKTRKPNNFFCSLSFVRVHFWQHPESSIAMKFTLMLKNISFYGHHVISLRWYLFGEHAVWD